MEPCESCTLAVSWKILQRRNPSLQSSLNVLLYFLWLLCKPFSKTGSFQHSTRILKILFSHPEVQGTEYIGDSSSVFFPSTVIQGLPFLCEDRFSMEPSSLRNFRKKWFWSPYLFIYQNFRVDMADPSKNFSSFLSSLWTCRSYGPARIWETPHCL